jgi:hypothetical protein
VDERTDVKCLDEPYPSNWLRVLIPKTAVVYDSTT